MGARPNVAAAVALRNRAWAYTCDAERLRAAGNTDDAAFYETIANELRQVAHDLAPSGAPHIHAGGGALDLRADRLRALGDTQSLGGDEREAIARVLALCDKADQDEAMFGPWEYTDLGDFVRDVRAAIRGHDA